MRIRSMTCVAGAAVVAAMLGSPAVAADYPVLRGSQIEDAPPAPALLGGSTNWSGFYFGGGAGASDTKFKPGTGLQDLANFAFRNTTLGQQVDMGSLVNNLPEKSDSGATVALEMAPYSTSIEWHESLLVCFEKGFVRVELPPPLARQIAGKVTIMKDNGNGTPSYEIPVMPNRSAMRQQAMNFIAAVRGERSAPCESKEALEDLKLARDYIRLMQQYQ